MNGLNDYLRGWAEKRPDAPAVECRDDSITYGELRRRSAALARVLRENNVAAGDRVALWLPKSIESVVAVHGILQAGAAYVPIDPSAPLKRVAHIISACAVACVVTDAARVEWLPDGPSRMVTVDPEGLAVVGGTAVQWERAPGPESLPVVEESESAYILHTSGSKGVPKGVVLSHGNARAFVEWAARELGLCPADRVASHAPFHFDLSILDLFATCYAGGCVVLVPESQVGLGGALNRLVAERRVTVWYSVPNALVRMLGAKNSSLLPGSSLRVIVFAGETFPIDPLRRLHSLVPAAGLYNFYGPTETNVCTFHRVRASDVAPDATRPVPIGRPCPYAAAFVLDESGRQVEHLPGNSGELCVAGDSVMLGYWGDDDLTAAKTVPIPRDGAEPLRAYRTGDLVRIDDDLNYVFCGRLDDMVKIRGHRVELGEIEAVLSGLENVREVACVAVGDGIDERRVEAYVVPDGDLDVALLRRRCLTLLPRYMVPERFHVMTALPLTRTGKIDRRLLVETP